MQTPATVRIEQASSVASSYRDAADERRRVVVIRGSSPLRARVLAGAALLLALVSLAWVGMHEGPDAGWLVVPGIVALLVLLQLGPMIAWRALQRARFELTRRELVVRTRPLGRSTAVEGWSARALLAIHREARWGKPLVCFAHWDVYAEREDGRRMHLATLYDEASVRFVRTLLGDAYREAEQSAARNPFAARFGPMPEGVRCEGNVEDPDAGWRIELRCARGNLPRELLSLAVLALLAPSFALATLSGLASVRSGTSLAGTFVIGLLTIWLLSGLYARLRSVVLRSRGQVTIALGPEGLDVETSPWRLRPLAGKGRAVSLRVKANERQPTEASFELVHAGGARPLLAPLTTDDATYAARVVAEHQKVRTQPR